VPARQREFIAGRQCAAEAIARLGLSGDALPIGEDGAPVWPPGVVGSIAHTDRIFWAAAARTQNARGVGIDLEPVMSRERAARVERNIVTRAEMADLVARTRFDRATALTLAFSAKEAVYKCLYPLVRRVFDYLDARVEDIDNAAGEISVRLVTTLSAEWTRGTRIHGRFDLDHDLVWTGFVLARDTNPRD
jgi:enterobactin synthetase component D